MAEHFSTGDRTLPTARSGGGKFVVLGIAAGLLVGAGIVTPVALNYRANLQKTEQARVDQANLAEKNKQEAVALEKQRGELRTNLGTAEKTITTLRDDLTTRTTALDSLTQNDAEHTKEIDTLRADVAAKSAAMADLDSRLKAARSEVDGATQQNTELATRVNSLRTEVSRMSETVQSQGVEITRLVDQVKTEQEAKAAALAQAAAQQQRAEVAEVKVEQRTSELMTLGPVRIEERRSTLKGRRLGKKSGIPLAGIFDPIGDAFQGVGEGLFGKSGPVELVGVYRDGHEEKLSSTAADKWQARGVQLVKITQ